MFKKLNNSLKKIVITWLNSYKPNKNEIKEYKLVKFKGLVEI